MLHESSPLTTIITPEATVIQNPRQLGEELFKALSPEERAARMVLAVFDEESSNIEFGREVSADINQNNLRRAAIARLLLEQASSDSDQRLLSEWQVDIEQIPEFGD